MAGSRSIASVAVGLVALVSLIGLFEAIRAAEVRFVAESVGNGRAIWLPKDVVIHKKTDLQGGLWFTLENPTDRTHAFAVYGLFEEMRDAQGAVSRKPLRVNVTPDDSVRVQVSTVQFEEAQESVNEEFEFFCPLHKEPAHLGGVIHMVP